MNFKEWLTDKFRGWVSPQGQRIHTDPNVDHSHHANKIIDKMYPGWEWWDNKEFCDGSGACHAGWALEAKNWVRVVEHSTKVGIYSMKELNSTTKRILMDLLGELDPETNVMLDMGFKSIEDGAGNLIQKLGL